LLGLVRERLRQVLDGDRRRLPADGDRRDELAVVAERDALDARLPGRAAGVARAARVDGAGAQEALDAGRRRQRRPGQLRVAADEALDRKSVV